MIFLDINTFYAPRAGGIRTYHQAKMEWFRERPDQAYFLVYPGAARRERKEGGKVTLVEAYGPALTGDPSGYRLLIDLVHVFRLIRRVRPDVLEAGDPWLTGLFCILLRKTGLFRGLLVSFYHSDPVPSYLEPWSRRGRLRGLKRILAALAAPLFYRLQRTYDLTAVASKAMEDRLRARGVRKVAHLPFGVPSFYLEGAASAPPKAGPGPGGVFLLYAGRLDSEKGIDLLIGALPAILARENAHVTVIGRGARADWFASFRHERFRYLGFLENPAQVRDIYDGQHILLAPGPYETFGLGVLEAMARGLVVVGPDQGGTGELLGQAQSPFSFRAGDGADFLKALAGAIACDWPKETGRSRALALRYGTWDQAIGRMVARYAEGIGRKAQAPSGPPVPSGSGPR